MKLDRRIKMDNNYTLKDTKQTKRLIDICLNSMAYSCKGEIYQLLNYKTLHDLVEKIKDGEWTYVKFLDTFF